MTDPRTGTRGDGRDPYRTVLEVGATLASSLELDEVFQTIARQVGEALGVQWCDINEYDAEAQTMTYVAVWSEQLRPVDLEYLGTVVSLEDRPGRDAVIRHGDLLETYLDDEDLDPVELQIMIDYDEKAVMEMPLEFGGETIGVLGVVESRRERRFTDDEKRLLRLLARPAATAIGNARLYREQREQASRMATLLDSSRALAASVDLDEVLANVARLAAEAVDAAYATVYEYRPHYLTETALQETASYLEVPHAQVYGVATFYHGFHTEPRGEHTCTVCMGTACHVRGAPRLLEQLERDTGVAAGGTTPDLSLTIEEVSCVGACALGPLVLIDDEYHGHMTGERLSRLVGRLLKKEEQA